MPNFNTTPIGAAKGSHSAKSEVNSIENDREFKAHIYQQLVELQPYLSADSQVAVMVEQESDENVSLTLVTTWGDYRVESEGKDSNMYSAFGIAKRKLVQQLDDWYNSAVDSNERDSQIDSLLDGSSQVH